METFNSKFIKNLTEEEIKELIAYCLIEHDTQNMTHFMLWFNSIDDIKYRILDSRERNEYKVIEFTLERHLNNIIHPSEILINDFSMILIEAPYSFKYCNMDIILHMYLTKKFGEDYTQELFNKRLKDAEIERKTLNAFSSDHLNNIWSKLENTKPKQKSFFRRNL